MLTTSTFAATAALVGDPARANMLATLMDGRALTATELARAAGITPQTASGHLARLTEAGLLAMMQQGRHRYHRLASPAVALMLESIMSVAAERDVVTGSQPRKAIVVGPRDAALRRARTCYDHLAGRLAVAIADRMVERAHVELSADGGVLTDDGAVFLRGLGVDLGATPAQSGHRTSGRMFCRPCLDWSERRPHIAGVLGAAFCQTCFAQGWLRRVDGARAVTITPAGQMALKSAFGLFGEV
jgi:DNA-binding transcriptional ArsR family regulator